jgi:O-antigen/teichoic acid export membrane protein
MIDRLLRLLTRGPNASPDPSARMSKSEMTGEPVTSSRRLALGALASGLVNIFKVGLQLVLLPVMARLLGPSEFGVYALALPTVSLVGLLADGGLGATLAREPESRSLVWSSAFWFLFLTGIVLALGTSAFGIFMGHMVAQPRVASMIAVLSLSIVFLVLAVPPNARLARRKNLGFGAAAELAANLSGAAVAIILGLKGAGAWSLVAQYLTVYAVRAVILNLAAFSLPTFEFSFDVVRTHLASGGLIVVSRLVDYSSRVGESVLVDRIFGTPILGSYTFANQISKFAGETVSNVAWATMYVQALTSDRRSASEIHRKLCRLVSAILFPTTFLAAAAAPELVTSLLGPKWVELSPLLRILLPIAAFSTVANLVTAVLLAINRFEVAFWCAVGLSLGRLLAVFAGVWIGLLGAVYGVAFVTLLYIAALLFYAEPLTGCHPVAMLRGLVGPTISSLAAAASCLLLLHLSETGLGSTIASLAIGAGVFAGCMLVIDRKGLTEDWETVRRIMAGPNTNYEQG